LIGGVARVAALMEFVAMSRARFCAFPYCGFVVAIVVKPESAIALAAARAVASVARCSSLRAEYNVTISIAKAAMANKLISDTATSRIV
jgi:hypothetical protein